MFVHSPKAILSAAAVLLLAGSAGADVVVTPLVVAGDVYLGGTVSTGFAASENMAVNNGGDWLIETSITGGIGIVLVAGSQTMTPGAVIRQVGDPVTAPAGATISSFDGLGFNNAGNYTQNLFYTNAPGSQNSGVHFNQAQLILESAIATAPQFTAGTPYIGWFEVRMNNADQILMLASVDDPAISSSVDRALVRVDDPTGAATQTVLLKEGDEVVPGRFLTDVATGPHAFAFADGSRAGVIADLDGATTDDSGFLFYDGAAWSFVAREGDPCSATPGRNWLNLASSPLDVNNVGGWVVRGSLDGDTATNAVIVKNGGAVVAQEGSPVPGNPAFTFTGFGTGAVQIDDSGNVYYYAEWNDPDTTRNAGLFLNNQLLAQKGVTPINLDFLLTDISAVQDNFSISDNGRYLLFEGVMTFVAGGNTLRGTFMITRTCTADTNLDGLVTVQDLFDFIGRFFANDIRADVNRDTIVSVQDIFDYIAAFFSPC